MTLGSNTRMMKTSNTSLTLSSNIIEFPLTAKDGITDKTSQCQIQSIIGTFLYYGRAVEPTILPAINEIDTFQSKATDDTIKRTNMFLDYMYTYPSATTLRYFYNSNLQCIKWIRTHSKQKKKKKKKKKKKEERRKKILSV